MDAEGHAGYNKEQQKQGLHSQPDSACTYASDQNTGAPILYHRLEQRHREVEHLAPGHTAGEGKAENWPTVVESGIQNWPTVVDLEGGAKTE